MKDRSIVIASIIISLFVISGISGCESKPKTSVNNFDVSFGGASSANNSTVTIFSSSGPQNFSVEIANNDSSRETGLMFRKSLDKENGMLFVYSDQDIRGFWMRNTLIPLDMIFINENLTVIDINKNAQPCNLGYACPVYYSKTPAQYILELKGSLSDEMNISIGNKVVLS